MSRALATVDTIADLEPIEGADLIERATVRGWHLVVKRGEFAVGDPCLYVEIDSMLPVLTDERFAFLAPRGVRRDDQGREGHVLKTVRLRGQVSQGLALPLRDFPEIAAEPGADATEALGIVKWEPPIAPSLQGKVRGTLPSWIPKTDEERIQNMAQVLLAVDESWVATEKIDGSSTTAYVDPTREVTEGVCSRNQDLVEAPGHTMWDLARKHGLHALLADTYPGKRAAVQGETYGPGIQGNPLGIKEHRLSLFNVLVDGVPLARAEWPDWALDMSVPVLDLEPPRAVVDGAMDREIIGRAIGEAREKALAQVDGMMSAINPQKRAEGVVWRHASATRVTVPGGTRDLPASWKAISNRYLMKNDR